MTGVLLSFPAWSFAHDPADDQPPPKVSPLVMYQPTANPDRVVLTWRGDTRTTQAVTWRTSTEVSRAFAEIAEAEAGPGFAARARRIDARTEVFVSDLFKCHAHSAEFTEL
ncbi:MAG: metallophosphoesterase, partial [Phycisphaerae bacterium]